MRILALALLLVSAPAFATNVLYQPAMQGMDGKITVMYLTNESESPCNIRPWHNVASEGDGAIAPFGCWSFLDRKRIVWSKHPIPNMQIGMYSPLDRYRVVPGEEPEFQLLLAEWRRWDDEMLATPMTPSEASMWKEARPHP